MYRYKRPPSETFSLTTSRFEDAGLVLWGPFLAAQGYSYLFACAEPTTRWPEAVTASEATDTLLHGASFFGNVVRFWVPGTLTIDHRYEFDSILFYQFMPILGIRVSTTVSRTAENGFVQQFRPKLKVALRAVRFPRPGWIICQSSFMAFLTVTFLAW